MNRHDRRADSWVLALCLGLACALLLVEGLAGPLQTASAALPPRPTPVTPTSTPTGPEEPAGAWIELRAYPPPGDPSFTWQELWTVVQWQDINDGWHDVEGWRGTPDRVAEGAGSKVWWVAQKDFGTGPFRWIVHLGQGSEHLVQSDPFTLPDAAGAILTIEVQLAP
jgi:hypothetical protein